MHAPIRLGNVMAVLLVIGSAACDDSERETATVQEKSPATGGPSGGTISHGDAAATLRDDEIVAVLHAANAGEIAQAETALASLRLDAVVMFAHDMISAHDAAARRQDTRFSAAGIDARESDASAQLVRESDEIVAQLVDVQLQDADLVYVRAQVAVHERLLTMIDEVLLPSASAPELVRELSEIRSEVSDHLDHARLLVDAIAGKAR